MSERITLYAKPNYDSPIGADGSGMTIAALHVAQDSETLSSAPMRRDVLTHLMSNSAVNYWKNTKHWLESCGKHSNGKNLLRLTSTGLSTCRARVSGGADTPTRPEIVRKWINDMRTGQGAATEPKEFDLPL
ncbi:hypothetical protein [Ectothiorhodospira shaposhnikovii]|uniref:hypothetical protein n=1 Tax=Ectothiorhodospira shaposhnikovii TaxID=1054 RepID=UPI0019087B01|nr:hypothetical protein [Ectothiorhodospira shaposhnikovii]